MSFSVHTFETNPKGNLGFAFHHNLTEGQNLYFLAKFTPDVSNTEVLAESIFGAIVDYFDEHKTQESYVRFEEALKMANKAVKKASSDITEKADILVAFFDFHHLYLSQAGNSEAYLIRNAAVSQISEFPEKGENLFLNILSGQVAIEDVVILSSHRVLRTLTSNQLVSTFNRSNFSEAVSVFRHELSAKSEEDILITIIGIGKKESLSAAGFLSKVIAQKDKLLNRDEVRHDLEYENKTESSSTDNQEISPKDVEDSKSKESIEKNTTIDETLDQKEPLTTSTKKSTRKFLDKIKTSPLKNIKNPFKRIQVPKNTLFIIGAIALLFMVILFVNSLNFESEEETTIREKLSIARENLQKADSFLLEGDKDSAKKNLVIAEKAAQYILKSKSQYSRSDAQFILANIQKKQLQVENAHTVTPKLVADLGVKNDNITSIGLSELRGNLYVHDSKKVYKTIRNVVEKGLTVSEKATLLAATTRKDQNLLLFLTNDPQIIEYKDGLLTPMRTMDENWKKGIDIKTYGRFTYILDPSENQIWKYERKRANYSGAIAYNDGADLSRSVSFAIDGAIYIIADDGSLQKIFRSQRQNYEFRDLPSKPIEGKNLKIYTTPDQDYLYVLDPDNERLLIFSKGDKFATYRKQIIFDVPNVRDFVVNDAGQKVNILTQDKIYEFPL